MGSEKHFGDAAWIDMTRGVAAGEQEAAMREHLAGGCLECTRSFRFWSLVAKVSVSESEYEAPEDAVQAVKAAFSARSESWLSRIRRVATLVFDSWQEPLPAGVRGSRSRSRHLLFETGEMVIDLFLEHAPNARVQLAGQAVSRKNNLPGVAASTWVELVDREERRITGANANSFGEFQLEFELQPELSIHVHALEVNIVPLPDP